ncbi:MAG: hypothetical protein HOI23_11290 [Deltaproteobacteria bacterium]|nr:hypothetical protein [Deltaproteobacteria bacterium]
MKSVILKWGAGVLLLIGTCVATPPGSSAGQAWAKDEGRKTVSTWTYKRLEEIQADITKERYPSALKRLKSLSEKSRLNSHERALLWQMYGFTYSTLGRYQEASKAFEKCLAQKSLSDPATQHTRYNLAQAYLASEAYPKAVEQLGLWLKAADKPTPEVFYLLAAAHMQLKQFQKALPHARKAVEMKRKPREAWLNLLMSLHFELKQMRSVLGVCKQLVSLYPKRSYWLQLSAVYNELGDRKRALATLELAYAQGYVSESSEILNLVSLYLDQGIPFKAGELLENELRSGRVDASLNNLKMLSSAWLQSRESARAWGSLERASKLDPTGQTDAKLAQLYLESEKWSLVHRSAQKAIEKGELKRPGEIYLINGIALMSLNKPQKARQAFKKAQGYPKRSKAAGQWLKHLRGRTP